MEDCNEHLKAFTTSLSALIARKYGLPEITDKSVTEIQKWQLEHLSQLEEDFRLTVIQSDFGPEVYEKFIYHIREERKNTLAARPFFRERQPAFTEHISGALKENNWRRLYRFHINYRFVMFAAAIVEWPIDSKVLSLKKEIETIRTQLVEMNLPLAIQRSKMFFGKTPKSHMGFMDFIQIATEGLMAAIDKFVLPYSKVFRSVAIGRMVGNFIEEYSSTHLHFFPTDRRKLYRANKFISRSSQKTIDFGDIAEYVNEKNPSKKRSTSAEIAQLMSASSTVSADTTAPGDDDAENISKYAAPESCRPDICVENNEAYRAICETFGSLNCLERKLLRLKGIEIEKPSDKNM